MASVHLLPDRTAPARARRFAVETLRGWDVDAAIVEVVLADLALLVSELVTNAVLHARSATDVTIERSGSTVRVSVRDTSRTRPRLRDYEPADVTGRGLLLLDRLATRWGVDDEPSGKSVWFELECGRSVDPPARATPPGPSR